MRVGEQLARNRHSGESIPVIRRRSAPDATLAEVFRDGRGIKKKHPHSAAWTSLSKETR